MATAKTPAKSAAKGKKPAGPKPGEYPGKIVDIDVSKEVSDSFLEYAYSVIYSRALPDARDGLKHLASDGRYGAAPRTWACKERTCSW
jgi:hypothetical protein